MSGETILIEQLRADVEQLTAERDEARANYAFMVERAADQRLDGYRELGARAAAAEERAERAERELASVEAKRGRLVGELASIAHERDKAEDRAEKAERELQASESCVAFERVTIAELRLEAHQLRTNLHLARLERDEARAERDALPEISDGLVSDAEHVVAWHRSGRIELSPAGRYSRLADYVLRVHAAKVKP